MRPDIDYQNHKNRQANFRKEAAMHRNIDVRRNTAIHKVFIQMLAGWVSQFKKKRTTTTQMLPDIMLSEERISS